MPRPPKSPHPLRDIRSAAGNLTQTAFAELVGVSMPTIQALEGGKLKLTATLAARIAEATGCAEAELLKGSDGKARTVDGQKFTAASFQAWQTLKQRRSKPGGAAEGVSRWLQWLLEAAQQSSDGALVTARTQIIEAMERVRTKLNLEDFINRQLVPFQTVETLSTDVSSWKKVDLPRHLALGFHPSLPLGPRSRLTISLQTLPSWSPGTPPPAPSPTNMDLIPAGYFVIGLGTAGCKMARSWWQDLVREHGIDAQTGLALYGSATGNWQGYFRRVPQMTGADKYVPRAIFADLDNESIRNLASGNSDLFHTGAFFTDDQGSSNVFAGSEHPGANKLLNGVENILARHSQDIGGISGIFLMHSLEGGTGGGLAQQLLYRLKAKLPGCPLVSVCPIPDPDLSHSVTAPYNLALSLQAVEACTQLALVFDPHALQEQAVKLWKLPVREVETSPNLLISSMLCSFTSPLRFPGGDSAPVLLADWIYALTSGDSAGKTTFLWPEISPLQLRINPKRNVVTAAELVKSYSALLKSPSKKSLPRAALFLRARQAEDIWGTSKVLVGSEAKFRVTSTRTPNNFETLTLLTDAGGLGTRLEIFARQATQLLQRKAYLHWYEELGISDANLAEAVGRLSEVAQRLGQISAAQPKKCSEVQ
jgi:transcriptional regulator with XRE-family HTH domain